MKSKGMNVGECAGTEPPKLEVIKQMDIQEKTMSTLSSIVDDLELKLKYITRSEDECELNGEPVITLVPLAEMLRSNNNSVERSIQRIGNILRNIQL